MDLEDMLREGFSADELRKEFEDELKEAMESIEQEKKIDEDEVEDNREALIDDILDYVEALGILDEDDRDDEDLYNKIEKAFIEFEQDIKEFMTFWSKLKVTKSEKHLDPDTVIKTFIATL